MKEISITEIGRVGEILDYVHDRYFDLDKIEFDEKKRTLMIPLSVILADKTKKKRKFLILSTWRNSVVKAKLIFKNVIDYTIEDKAQIGEADINTIYWEGKQLIIKCGIPVVVRLNVTACSIEFIASDDVIDEVKRFEFSF